AVAVHLGDDERVAVGEAVRAGLVYGERAALDGVRDELARAARAAGEEDEIEAACGQDFRRRLFDRQSAVELAPGRARGGAGTHVPVAPFAQEPERHGADRAGRADNADPCVARRHAAPSSNASCSAATAFGTSSVRTWQAILIGDVEMTSGSTPIPPSVA